MTSFKLLFLIPFLMMLYLSVDAEQDLQKIYDASKQVARDSAPNLQNLAKGGDGIDKVHGALQNKDGDANHQSTELGDLANMGEKAKENEKKVSDNQNAEDAEDAEDAENSCTKDDCNVASIMSTNAINEREASLEKYGFRKNKDGISKDNKGYIDKAKHNAKEYENKFNAISGSYKDCKAKAHNYSYKETSSCDEYYDVKYSNCNINQVVEIDPKYTYQCSKKRDESIKTCHDEIVSIKCRKSSECDNGGLILSSVKTNLQNQTYKYPTLYVGTPYWEPYYCRKDDTKYTTFEVKNLKQIKQVILSRVMFDDHLLIKINGKKVYLGPEDDGDRLEVLDGSRRGAITTNGINRKVCERATNWDRSPNIDLIPFLKEGENTISITIVTAGHGNAQMWINVVQHCCKEEDWVIERKTACESEGMNE